MNTPHLPVGASRDPERLRQVRQAIEAERRLGRRPTLLQIEAAHLVVPHQAIWRLDVSVEGALDPGTLEGGRLERRLVDDPDARPFRAEIIEVDPIGRRLWVTVAESADGEASEEPSPGASLAFPFDFLRAMHALAHTAALEPLRADWLAMLGPASGALDPTPIPGPEGLHGAWRWPWTLVWGPPGTGKTTTVASQVVRLLDDPRERVLVVTNTNQATDDLALRLGHNLRVDGRHPGLVVRAGRITDLQRFERARLTSVLPGEHARHQEIAKLHRTMELVKGATARAPLRKRLRELLDDLPKPAEFIHRGMNRVVVTTLHAAISAITDPELRVSLAAGVRPFTTVVLDEAGLVSRMHAAAAALLASRRVVLVGDPRQLAPVARAERTVHPDVLRWLSRSGLSHLGGRRPDPWVQRLNDQRRMHPDICAAVSALAYDGDLRDHASVVGRPWPGAGTLHNLPRALWYVLDAHPETSPADVRSQRVQGGSRERAVFDTVMDAILDHHPELETVESALVVTPYRGQRDRAARWIARRGLEGWAAATVHAQQGSEADVVVFDTVHAASTGWSRADWERLVNVGLSRARQLVLVLASRDEVAQPYLRPLRPHLAPRVLVHHGQGWRWTVPASEAPSSASPSLFGRQPLPSPALAAEPPPPDDPADLPAHSVKLGAQIDRRRQLRPLLSAEQARLVHRDLSDAGPRLVRGVAGSGKTLVLAHWAVRLLRGQTVPSVTICYANRALRPLLERMLQDAWDHGPDPVPRFPSDRVHLVHIRELLEDLLRERELPGPGRANDRSAWDYEHQAERILAAGPAEPRWPAVCIDEAQDMGHAPLQLLVQLTRPIDGRRSVLVFYDNAQNIYGRGTPNWRALGLDVRGRSTVMRESFRSTRQNVELALNVVHRLRPLDRDPELRQMLRPSAGEPLVRLEDGRWHVDFCDVDGQLPTIQVFSDARRELTAIAEQVRRWVVDESVRPSDIRILAIHKAFRTQLEQTLRRVLGDARVVQRTSEGFDNASQQVIITTPHSYKGYDAEIVVVAGADRFHHRDGSDPKVPSRADTAALYVALTRARSLMLVTATRRPGEGPARDIVEALRAEHRLQDARLTPG